MPSAKELYDLRLKRVYDAIALTEPDTVPMCIIIQTYPFIQAGYTMADILYDTDFSKARKSIFQFLDTYQPDYLFGQRNKKIGEGPILELGKPKTVRWAGMPGDIIDKNSIHQYIEFPILDEEEFEVFMRDRTWWILNKAMPRTTELLEPMAKWRLQGNFLMGGHTVMAQMLSSPETKEMIQTLWKIQEMNEQLQANIRQLDADIEAYGYPTPMMGFAAVPFDEYSDNYRGTVNGMIDMLQHPDFVLQYCRETLESMKALIRWQGTVMPGRFVFMALHKGLDGFMSDEQYRKFYWNDLQEIILTIIDSGMTPYIFTEGPYDSRVECLKEVPRGKVLYHFERVDMVRAKKILGDTACISGGFPVYLLEFGTKQQVIDEAKRLIDGCAAGGGFIFETACGIDNAKPENVEALVDTVRTYGKR